MSTLNLNAISENASRLGMRIQETLSERSRDFHRRPTAAYFDAHDEKGKDLGRQLNSSSEREKLDALKCLVAFISRGRNVSEYFPHVVKNVASPNVEVRKLVYIYLLRHAQNEPDLALLSINTFQKDLTDPNPVIRAVALRVLSGIKVPMIASLVVLAIKKCAADISPYVRTGAALAILKCCKLDSSNLPVLIEVVSTLLRDRSPLSIGSVAVAFESACPARLDLLHRHYRQLCKILVDVDEWGQVHLLSLLTRYARVMLPRPVVNRDAKEHVDADLQLLLTSSEPLLQSRNPAVVIAVARLFFYIGLPSQVHRIIRPLMRFLQVSHPAGRVALKYIVVATQSIPHLFSPFYARFFIRADDISPVKQEKICILLNVINNDNFPAILREFIDCAEDVDDCLVAEAIHAVGRCATLIPESTQQCLAALIAMMRSIQDVVVGNAVLVLKHLIQAHSKSLTKCSEISLHSPQSIVSFLARRVDNIRHPPAKACVIWLVGQYSASNTPEDSLGERGVEEWVPDVLRKSAKSFRQESPSVKLQIVNLAAKLMAFCPSDRKLTSLSQLVFTLARYDFDCDVRDRARMLSSLVTTLTLPLDQSESRGGVILRREQVQLVLYCGKSATVDDVRRTETEKAAFGYLASVIGKSLVQSLFLPDWPEEGTDSSLRETEGGDGHNGGHSNMAVSVQEKELVPSTWTSSDTQDMGPSTPMNMHLPPPSAELETFYADDGNGSEGESSSQLESEVED